MKSSRRSSAGAFLLTGTDRIVLSIVEHNCGAKRQRNYFKIILSARFEMNSHNLCLSRDNVFSLLDFTIR